MRIGSILTAKDLPQEELQVGVLDGELSRLGNAFCTIDTIVASAHRASSIAPDVPDKMIAERHTAAWVYGVVSETPRRFQLCVDTRAKFRPTSNLRFEYREVVLREMDVVDMGGLRVTTPVRTAVDIARFSAEFSDTEKAVVRGLAGLGDGFTLATCRELLNARRNLPYKRQAERRLNSALGVPAAL